MQKFWGTGSTSRNLFITVLLSFSVSLVYAWGYWAHQRINRAAIFALPEEMRRFFFNHIDFISEESVIPDVRKYVVSDRAEPNRHYIDIELLKRSPQETIPVSMKEAITKYNDTLVQKAGILPWYIDTMMVKLTNAFKNGNKSEILFLAADLAHYIGDAHMPLHTSVNHDGQLTGQKGIHALWESYLPEKFGGSYNLKAPDAIYVDDVKKEIWRIIYNSHDLVDSVLIIQRRLNNEYAADQVYIKDTQGNVIKNKYNQSIYSLDYAARYHKMLNGMVEKQMKLSIIATSNFWYTAWVNAGRPNLSELDPQELTKRNNKNYKDEIKLWKQGKLFGLKTGNEF